MRADVCGGGVALSIVVPAYNAAKHIIRTLTTLEDQTVSRERYEIIVIDDGSGDDTLRLCTEFAGNFGNIRVAHQDNGGVSSARNLGITLAGGTWISFVDSDDYVDRHYVQTMLTTCPNADYVIFDHLQDWDGKPTPAKQWLRPWFDRKVDIAQVRLWICDNLLNTPWDKRFSLAVIRSHGLRFPEGIHMGEDLLFNFHYSLRISSAFVSGQTIYVYTDNSEGLCRKRVTPERLAEFETIYQGMMEACEENHLGDRYRGVTNLSFLRSVARCAGQLHTSGFSTRSIAKLFDGSDMVKNVVAEPSRSMKNILRKWLLKLRLYGVCARVFREK